MSSSALLLAAIGVVAAPPAGAALNLAPQCLVREVQIPMTSGDTYKLSVGRLAADPEKQPVSLLGFTDGSIWQAGRGWIDDNRTPTNLTDDSFIYQRPTRLGSRSTQKFSIRVGDGVTQTTCVLDITAPRIGLG